MASDALTLAALATAAVPGLRAVRVELLRSRPGDRFGVAIVDDAEHRRWIVRMPVDAVAAAQQDASVALLGLLARRVPFVLPAPKGFAAVRDGRRAMVYPMISGHDVNLAAIPSGPGLAAELGRALAALHNVDRRLYDEAAMPHYDAEECRRRHVVEVDRGAVSGIVPVGLLSRWERLLDDVSMWRFAPTPTHGRLDGAHLLAAFASQDDLASGRVRALLSWEEAQVGDPAEDLAALVAAAPQPTVDTVLEAYTMSRIEHPDPHLEARARILAELRLVENLLAATSAKDRRAIAAATHALRRLDAAVGDPDVPPAPIRPDPAADVVPAPPPGDDRLYRGGRGPFPGPSDGPSENLAPDAPAELTDDTGAHPRGADRGHVSDPATATTSPAPAVPTSAATTPPDRAAKVHFDDEDEPDSPY